MPPDSSQNRPPFLEVRLFCPVASRAASTHSRGMPGSGTGTAGETGTGHIDFWIAFSNVVIVVRRLIRKAWARYRWESRPSRRP